MTLAILKKYESNIKILKFLNWEMSSVLNTEPKF